jgi:adenine-specific DNA-methyltransferase
MARKAPRQEMRKTIGQYFTLAPELQDFVFSVVKHKSAELLEPSFGAGHLLRKFKEYDSNYPMACYELDAAIPPVVNFNDFQQCTYGDFTTQNIRRNFRTIVGNPPYVKRTAGNLYIVFIELCYNYLADDGELVFIVPSDFLKATRAAPIIATMAAHGSFTDFLFPHNEQLFPGANIDVMVFRYEKGLVTATARVNNTHMFCNIVRGIITFSAAKLTGVLAAELFDVYVGLVSGRDEIYKVPFGNMTVLTDDGQTEAFIFADAFPCGNAAIDAHLAANKAGLLARRIRKFGEHNWHEWGAPRNISSIRRHWDRPCIYVRNITRNATVAFAGRVQYFGGGLLCLVPKHEAGADAANMQKIIDYLNSAEFQANYRYAGRFKIGHKQISSTLIPT